MKVLDTIGLTSLSMHSASGEHGRSSSQQRSMQKTERHSEMSNSDDSKINGPSTQKATQASVSTLRDGQSTDNQDAGQRTTFATFALRDPHEDKKIAVRWLSWKLKHPFWIAGVILFELGITGTLIVLMVLSYTRQGFVPVHDTPLFRGKSSVAKMMGSQSLLWTSLPVLLMTILRAAWGMIVSAAGQRQPFVDMERSKPEARSAKRTLTLDYSSVTGLWVFGVAFKNGHMHLGFAYLVALVFGLVPTLTAHLFQPAIVTLDSNMALTQNSTFNMAAPASSFNLRPPFDVATASQIYGGTPPLWTTLEYSLQPFTIQNNTKERGNLTADVRAYSSYLACSVIPPSQYTLQYSNSGGESITLSTTDRGCSVSKQLLLSDNTVLYGQTFSTQTCSSEAGFTRVGMINCQYDSSAMYHVANLSFISCATSYWQSNGPITISWSPGQEPAMLSFLVSNNSSQQINPSFTRGLETQLSVTSVFDPTAVAHQDDFARIVYTYASKLNASSPLSAQTMASAMSNMWTTMYATLVSTQAFQVQDTQPLIGVLSTSETRLFVFLPIAVVILVISLLVLVLTIILFVYSRKKESILMEEPVGLLGTAILLDRSDVMELVRKFRLENNGQTPRTKTVVKMSRLGEKRCYFEGSPLQDGRLVVE